MDWKLAIMGLSGVLALAGIAVFLVLIGKKAGHGEEEEAKRKRAEAEAQAVADSEASQREREEHHVERVEDIIRHTDDLGPGDFELRLNSYPAENRATHAAGARKDADKGP